MSTSPSRTGTKVKMGDIIICDGDTYEREGDYLFTLVIGDRVVKPFSTPPHYFLTLENDNVLPYLRLLDVT